MSEGRSGRYVPGLAQTRLPAARLFAMLVSNFAFGGSLSRFLNAIGLHCETRWCPNLN